MTISLFLDVVVAMLLVITISYAVILNRRLSQLRRHNAELESLAASFSKATVRAGESTVKLKGAADKLEASVSKAEALRDDLQFLIERGGTAADRLEAGVRASRNSSEPEVAPVAGPSGSGNEAETAESRSEAERQLIRALQSAR